MNIKHIDIPFRSRSSDSDFICKDGEITSLAPYPSSRLPVTPDIDFALVRERQPGWHLHPEDFPVKTLVASDPSMEYWNSLGAQLLSQFVSEAGNMGRFVSPFYVMAVWKTYDGAYLSPSQPVLLTPNSEVPLVATDGDIRSTELEFKIAAAVCSLYFRMRAPESLRDWVGTIESLEIFVSPPLQNYNTYGAFLPYKHITTDNYCESLDLTTGLIAQRRICTETLKLAWKANLGIRDKGLVIGEKTTFYPVASVPLSEVDIKEDWGESGIRDKGIGDKGSGEISYGEILAGDTVKKSGPIIIEGEGKEISVTTRPLKITNATEFKLLRRAYLRGNFLPANITFSVYGSYDMREWWCISVRKGGAELAFPGSAFRFFKVVVTGKLDAGENLQGLSLKYQ